MVRIIDNGDKHKKGNAKCPQCSKAVLIERHWGDPPKCGDCGIPYRAIPRQPKYY